MSGEQAACPVLDNTDRRKSAAMAARYVKEMEGAHRIRSAAFARSILRNQNAFQAGADADAEKMGIKEPEQMSVFFLDGVLHHKKRLAIAKFFSAKTVTTQHRPLMETTTDKILATFRENGSAELDKMSFELAATVVSEILGLTNSDHNARTRRIANALKVGLEPRKPGLVGHLQMARMAYATLLFLYFDVLPAKRARLKQRQDDVLSLMIDGNYADRALLIECLTYGSAGMMTTREFIVMCAWYLFEQPELRARYLDSNEQGQLAILLEILRLEPVAAMVHRRVTEEVTTPEGVTLPTGQIYAVDIRASNTDEDLVGACPFALDPDRAERQRENGRYLSFADGPHNCPGWQVALHETRIFLDRLFRMPGITLKRAPDMSWNTGVQGYELRNGIVGCDPA